MPSLDLELGPTTQAVKMRMAATVTGTLAGIVHGPWQGWTSLLLITSASSLADIMSSRTANVTAAEGGAAAAAKPVQ